MTQKIKPKRVIIFIDENGNEPYINWLNRLKDQKTKERIKIRVRRLESGLYGDYKAVGEGVLELRMFFGAGYRVYIGEDGENIVILLLGGDKGSQKQDIEIAKLYWKEYKENG